MNFITQESRNQMEKKKEIYSYMLRFNKELERDRQALEKITQFCRAADMTMKDAILLVLATADTSALHKNILSLTASMEKNPEKEADGERGGEAGEQNPPVSSGRDLENRPVHEKEQEKKAPEKKEPVLDSMFDDIFNNF